MRLINRIVVHCSDSLWGNAAAIYRWHTDPKPRGNAWGDIGYHAVIGNGFPETSRRYVRECDGLLEPGRPMDRMGAHVGGANRGSLGVCMIGKTEFTSDQFNALERLLVVWASLYRVPAHRIVGHYELDGKKTCPNFSVREFLEMVRID